MSKCVSAQFLPADMLPLLCVQAQPGASWLALHDRAGPPAKSCTAQHRLRGDPPLAGCVESEQPALGASLDPGPRRQCCPAGQAPGHRGVWQICGCVCPSNSPTSAQQMPVGVGNFMRSPDFWLQLSGALYGCTEESWEAGRPHAPASSALGILTFA